MTNADYMDYLAHFTNTPAQAKSLLHSLVKAGRGIGFYMNSDKTEFMCLKQDGAISALNGKPLKLVDHFGSNISFTESNVSVYIEKVWTAFDRLSIICVSDL